MEGFLSRTDDTSGRYWDVIAYSRPLTDLEIENYDLDYIGKDEENGN